MKHKLVNLLGIVSIILLCCTLLCGLWVGSHPISDLKFHAMLSAISVVIAIITQMIFMFKCKFCVNHRVK